MLSVLRRLDQAAAQHRAWSRPSDIGGTDNSHHASTLAKLAKRGLVRYKLRGMPEPPPGENGQGRGNRCYQITPAGRKVLEEYGL